MERIRGNDTPTSMGYADEQTNEAPVGGTIQRPARCIYLMRNARLAIELVGAAALLIAALGVGNALRAQRAEPSPTPSPEPSAIVALAASTQRPQPNCVALGQIAPAPVPQLATPDLGNGTKSITSVEGGYTLVVPSAWLVEPGILSTTAWFGQTHITSYDPKTIGNLGPEAPGMLSPKFGISLDLQLWWNPTGEALDLYAQRIHIGPDQKTVLPGGYVMIGGRRAYHMTIQDEHGFQPTTGPVVITTQTRPVWIIPTDRADRLLVVYATPGESDLFPAVEKIVEGLVLFRPASPSLPVIHQRDEMIDRWLYDKTGARIADRRVEAKLMTYTEAVAAFNRGGGISRIDRDPDELFWLVVVSGSNLPQGRGSPAGTLPPTTWIMYEAPATNDRYEMTGTSYASTGTWPANFDALPDRCR